MVGPGLGFDFEGRGVLVTGATSGIGRAAALAFAKHGARVIATGRSHGKGERLVAESAESEWPIQFVPADLQDPLAIGELFRHIQCLEVPLSHAVHSAGAEGSPFVKTADYEDEVWQSVLDLNVTSVWRCIKHELRHFQAGSGGTIVNIASVAGLRASLTGGCAYTASKHALVGLTRTVAKEYATQGVRANVVCPAIIRTPMAVEVLGDDLDRAGEIHPLGRLGEPCEVANAILWLSSPLSSFITGIAMPVDGGKTA